MILVVFFKHTLVNIFYLTIFLGLAVLFCYFAVSSPIDIPVLHFEKCSGGNHSAYVHWHRQLEGGWG